MINRIGRRDFFGITVVAGVGLGLSQRPVAQWMGGDRLAYSVTGATVPEYQFAGMLQAANSFLGSLSAAQRSKALFAFDDGERVNWHFVRALGEAAAERDVNGERELARGILQRDSADGLPHCEHDHRPELVLRGWGEPDVVDPELYYFSTRTPSRTAPWGLRAEGHQLSLNFTLVRDTLIATPRVLRSEPSEVRAGARRGFALGG